MRSSRSRATDPELTKFFDIGHDDFVGINLRNVDFYQNKSRLYYMMKKIESGKISLPIKDVTKGLYCFGLTNDGKLELELMIK